MAKKKVVHLTSVHPRHDNRIFWKECVSLSRHGYHVELVVADGKGDSRDENIAIYDAGRFHNRLDRLLRGGRAVYGIARRLDADIYHFHDPELLPTGLKLKRLGKIVIFDSHEDVSHQLLSKPYIWRWLRRSLSFLYSRYETHVCRQLDGVVAATDAIKKRFSSNGISCATVKNYPILQPFPDARVDRKKHEPYVCYVGSLTTTRGIVELVKAIENVRKPVRLKLAGRFGEAGLHEKLQKLKGWKKTDYLGWLEPEQVDALIRNSMAGLVTLHPTPSYIESLPVKMFEYMRGGVPVIASDFPLWRDIVMENGCGVCVDPLNPQEIAIAIDRSLSDPVWWKTVGERAKLLVLTQYDWKSEEEILLNYYSSILFS